MTHRFHRWETVKKHVVWHNEEQMFRSIRNMQRAVADYTVGTVIVMVHMATAERRARRLALLDGRR